MAEQQHDRDLEFIDLFDSETSDERREAILAKLRESPEEYQRYEAQWLGRWNTGRGTSVSGDTCLGWRPESGSP